MILKDGEMSEWLKEHAWKSTLLARADALQNAPTHFPTNNFRNIDTRRRVLVNHRVDRGFEGVCDTVLTQCGQQVAPININADGATAERIR